MEGAARGVPAVDAPPLGWRGDQVNRADFGAKTATPPAGEKPADGAI